MTAVQKSVSHKPEHLQSNDVQRPLGSVIYKVRLAGSLKVKQSVAESSTHSGWIESGRSQAQSPEEDLEQENRIVLTFF